MDIYHTRSLVNEIYDLDKSSIPFRNLISKRKWSNHLSTNEIDQINEVWSKFVYSESFLSESAASSTPRIRRWEQFIKLEDEKGNYSLTNEGIWDKIKSGAGKVASAIGKGLKSVSRAVAGNRSLEKGGSLFGLGKKSKAQQAEYAKLEQDQKELLDILKAATSKDYPNNRDVEEFKTQTMKAIGDAEAFIKTHEDPGVRAEMYKSVKKWISYLLDQKIGDHYKHFMENMSLAGAMLILEAEEEKKEEEEALGMKKGSSESIKGLNSKVLPTVLKVLGGAGLAVAAGILATHPEIFSSTAKAVVTDDVQTITTEVDKVVGPIEIKERFATKFVPEFIDGLKAKGDIVITGDPGHNSSDFLDFVAKNFGNGDKKAGLTAFFDSVKMDTAGGGNVDYILKRMAGGMDVQEAFKMPGSVGGAMERFGVAAGQPISIGGIVAKQLVNKVVKTTITRMVGAGVLGSAGLATAAAVAGAVGAGGLLSGFAISRLREKSKKDSRAAFLDDLMDKVGEIEQKEEETSPVPPPEPPPEEDDDRDRGEDEGEAGPGPEPTPGPTPRPEPEAADEESQKDKKVEKLGQDEVATIVDNVMKDLGTYMEEIDADYNSEVPKDVVAKLVNLLNDKGKLKFSEYNRDDKTIKDIMSTAGQEKSKAQQDNKFLKNIPPAYKAIPNQWKRKQPDLSADISDILGDKILPMHMLALRRALSESLLKSIFKHARIIYENIERNNLILERWNKLAGLIT